MYEEELYEKKKDDSLSTDFINGSFFFWRKYN